MKILKKFCWLIGACALLAAAPARADLSFEIVGVGSQQFPIAIMPFQNEVVQSQQVTPVISNDLARTGLFRMINTAATSPVPSTPAQLDSAALTRAGAQTALVGKMSQSGGNVVISYWLVDAATKRELIAFELKGSENMVRWMGHQIADQIYEKLTGEKGAFASKIAYVLKSGGSYQLQVADSDGFGAQTILSSKEPIMSPKWSPDGVWLAYVSFEQRKPIIYIQNRLSGKRRILANFMGSNVAPAWSTDGRRLAVVLSKEGGSHLYLINADGSGLKRLTYTGDINTEPSFSPDGKYLLFTSNRGGSAQVYRMSAGGGEAERLTMEGSQNTSAKMSPDGRSMVYITNSSGGFRLAVMDLASRQTRVLSDASADDAPSFSANGRMILFETVIDQRNTLGVISVDGRVRQSLKPAAGTVRQPAWGPLL